MSMTKITTYFRIAPEAQMAFNDETGEPAPAYAQISTDHRLPLKMTEDEIHQGHKEIVCQMAGLPPELVEIISKEEYDAEMGEDDG